jgi:hypothetical protein
MVGEGWLQASTGEGCLEMVGVSGLRYITSSSSSSSSEDGAKLENKQAVEGALIVSKILCVSRSPGTCGHCAITLSYEYCHTTRQSTLKSMMALTTKAHHLLNREQQDAEYEIEAIELTTAEV